MITKLAIWYLRKRKVSAVIGFYIDGGHIRPINNRCFLMDNKFMNIKFLKNDGEELDIPRGKFTYEESIK